MREEFFFLLLLGRWWMDITEMHNRRKIITLIFSRKILIVSTVRITVRGQTVTAGVAEMFQKSYFIHLQYTFSIQI